MKNLGISYLLTILQTFLALILLSSFAVPIVAQKKEKSKVKQKQSKNSAKQTIIQPQDYESVTPSNFSSSFGFWGGRHFPISPSDANGDLCYGIDWYYSVNAKMLLGVGLANLPYKLNAPEFSPYGATHFYFTPLLFQIKYLLFKKIFIGAGLGLVSATGDVGGSGVGVSLLGGYAIPLKDSLDLEIGVRGYIIKDSKSDPYTNLIPNIGITYKF